MQKKLIMAMMALSCAPLAYAQSDSTSVGEAAFTFTEAQLGEDDNMEQNISIVNSNSNAYASGLGYLFSPMRFRYRALNQKYNEIYINGAPVNDMESGQFRYSLIGGLNQQTRGMESALPFESNNFAMSGMGGSNNYNFRPAAMPTGHRVTLSGANRNYTLRGMYTYNSGLTNDGWAFSANVTYRWANRGYVPCTFYNALSYFFGIQKPPLHLIVHVGQPHRARVARCVDRRDVLAGQQLPVQPILGLPKWQETQQPCGERLLAGGYLDMGLEHERQEQVDHLTIWQIRHVLKLKTQL